MGQREAAGEDDRKEGEERTEDVGGGQCLQLADGYAMTADGVSD